MNPSTANATVINPDFPAGNAYLQVRRGGSWGERGGVCFVEGANGGGGEEGGREEEVEEGGKADLLTSADEGDGAPGAASYLQWRGDEVWRGKARQG